MPLLTRNVVVIGLCCFVGFLCCLTGLTVATLHGEEPTSAARGYSMLRTHPYLPPDFDEAVLAALWTVWPQPERAEAERSDAVTRRRLIFSYYGIIPESLSAEPDLRDVGQQTVPMRPLGYVVDVNGTWTMNCLACHGGKVAGRVIPGLPNSHTALQTLTEDVRLVKLQQGKKLTHLDLATLQLPLSTTNGTTNAVMFGVVLGTYRNLDMTVDTNRKLPKLLHHDMDAPPYWNVRKKQSLYADGHAPKTPRPLMQFILLPRVTPATLAEWEPQFADLLAWIESLEPPKYPFEINRERASRGERVFVENCSRCHGTYGPNGQYEQHTVSLDEVGTDPLRFRSLTVEHRQWVKDGWLSRFGADPVEVDPLGYVAPPLDGIWASAPYFHNGSVPTLWHVLHPDSRPLVWKRTEDGYDQEKVGLEAETFENVPRSAKQAAHRRRYFDAKLPGKSASGHTFPNVLDEADKQTLLEYLKTL